MKMNMGKYNMKSFGSAAVELKVRFSLSALQMNEYMTLPKTLGTVGVWDGQNETRVNMFHVNKKTSKTKTSNTFGLLCMALREACEK